MLPGIRSSAISVKIRGGFLRFCRAGGKNRGHLLFPRDYRCQAFIGGVKVPFHNAVNAAGDSARINIRVLLPWPDDFQPQQSASDIRENEIAVGCLGPVERGNIDGREALLELMQCLDLPFIPERE